MKVKEIFILLVLFLNRVPQVFILTVHVYNFKEQDITDNYKYDKYGIYLSR